MIGKDELIKRFDDYVHYFKAYCSSDTEDHEMLKAVLFLLKEQEELLRKLGKDKDKLCLEVSEWKHKYHDRPLKEQDAVEPYITGNGESFETAETWWYACGNCNEALDVNDALT